MRSIEHLTARAKAVAEVHLHFDPSVYNPEVLKSPLTRIFFLPQRAKLSVKLQKGVLAEVKEESKENR